LFPRHCLWKTQLGQNTSWVRIFWRSDGSHGFLNSRAASAPVSPPLSIAPVFVAGRESKSIQIPISLTGANHKTVETVALINCGAFGCFVDGALVAWLGWKMTQLDALQTAYNVNGTPNNNGLIWNSVSLTLWIGDKDEQHAFYIIQCGNKDAILGLHWLHNANPSID